MVQIGCCGWSYQGNEMQLFGVKRGSEESTNSKEAECPSGEVSEA